MEQKRTKKKEKTALLIQFYPQLLDTTHVYISGFIWVLRFDSVISVLLERLMFLCGISPDIHNLKILKPTYIHRS